MSNELPAIRGQGSVELQGLVDQAISYAGHATAPNSTRAYRGDWADFSTWCNVRGVCALPAELQTVALYLTDKASTCKASTLQRRITAISQAHRLKGLPPISARVEPLHSVWAGIKRVHGTAQLGKSPITVEEIRAMMAVLPDNLLGLRDRAIILLGFAGAFRRSELVAIQVSDVEFRHQGLVVTVRRSKTDQDGQGRRVAIPYGNHPLTCPVGAVADWMTAAAITEGHLLRQVSKAGRRILTGAVNGRLVARVVKRAAQATGLNPTRYGGHSLRSGLATAAAAAGVNERAIMNQTDHKSVAMVRRYIREGSLFRENAASMVGL